MKDARICVGKCVHLCICASKERKCFKDHGYRAPLIHNSGTWTETEGLRQLAGSVPKRSVDFCDVYRVCFGVSRSFIFHQ